MTAGNSGPLFKKLPFNQIVIIVVIFGNLPLIAIMTMILECIYPSDLGVES
jgi:hypothetical protein